MYKAVFTLFLVLIFSFSALAERSQYIDLNVLNKAPMEYNDIGYVQFMPEFEENTPPEKRMTIEIFFGEYDESESSKAALKHIKEIIADDKKLDPKFKLELIALSNQSDSVKNTPMFQNFRELTGTEDEKVHVEKLPNSMDYAAEAKRQLKKNRYPSSMMQSIKERARRIEQKMGRKAWTFVRFSSALLGSYGAIMYTEGISQYVLASVALMPALGSGGLSYFSNAYGGFLTNEKWTEWLMTSNSKIPRALRKAFKLNPKTFLDFIEDNPNLAKERYSMSSSKRKQILFQLEKLLVKKPKEILGITPKPEKVVDANAKPENYKGELRLADKHNTKVLKVLKKLPMFEEYFKWWVTEVAFVGLAIKIPQAMAGIGEAKGILAASGDVLAGSLMGMLAQGPGDIAIQQRKYQMVQELKNDILSGKVKVDQKAALLDEIEKVLASSGEYKNYIITDSSHEALRYIENVARKRAAILSFFAVMGVGAELAQIPLATPILVATGTWGAGYYMKVNGWLKPKVWAASTMKFIKSFDVDKIKHPIKHLRRRWCIAPFLRHVD